MKRLLVLPVLCFLLAGCQSRMLEEQALVVSMGVDMVEGGIRLCAKIPSNSPQSGGEKQAEDEGYILLEAVGKDWEQAIALMHATVPRTMNFSQTREIVLGESVSRSPEFFEVLRSAVMLPRVRQAATLVSCKGEAMDFIKMQKAYLGIRLGQYLDVSLSNYAGKGFIPVMTLGEAFRDFGRGWRDPLLVYGAVNDFSNKQPLSGDNPMEAAAGALPRESQNKNEFVGAAATDGVCVSGVLTGNEMQMVSLVGGGVQSLVIKWKDEYVTVRSRLPVEIGYDREENALVLRAYVILEYKAGASTPDETAVDELKSELMALIRKLQGFRCDALGFGMRAARGFATLEEWEAFGFREHYASADVQLLVDARAQEVN